LNTYVAPLPGLERNDFYITYEPVGHMLRNSRGITPRNNLLLDTFWGLVGTVSVSPLASPRLVFVLSAAAVSP
jgi:hypothetical protein